MLLLYDVSDGLRMIQHMVCGHARGNFPVDMFIRQTKFGNETRIATVSR